MKLPYLIRPVPAPVSCPFPFARIAFQARPIRASMAQVELPCLARLVPALVPFPLPSARVAFQAIPTRASTTGRSLSVVNATFSLTKIIYDMTSFYDMSSLS